MNPESEGKGRGALPRHEFAATLRQWYLQHARDLPWRRSPSLYKTVVSEFMLQQTQVRTALPFFERWMDRFPDFAALASADEAEVLRHWEGLGYYSRARNLHRLARELMEMQEPPATHREWMRLPGIGPYTAAAVSSIAQGEPVACVDGNVVRILARICAVDTPLKGSAAALRLFRPIADKLLDHDDPGTHNQAMMELGATVCFRRNPLCTVCPVVNYCEAARQGQPENWPIILRGAQEKLVVTRLWIRDKSQRRLLLWRRQGKSRRLAGFYELPESSNIDNMPSLDQQEPIARRRRGISNQQITEIIYEISVTPELTDEVNRNQDLVWVSLDDLSQTLLSGPHRKWINELLDTVP